MNLAVAVRKELCKLSIVRYVETGEGYRAILRDPKIDPDIDQVGANIETIYARYHLEQGVEE